MTLLSDIAQLTDHLQPLELTGVVSEVRGLTVRVDDLSLPVGATVRIDTHAGSVMGEVVGFDHERIVVMLLGDTVGIRRGDRVEGLSISPLVMLGPDMLGRVVDSLGRPRDSLGPLPAVTARPLRPPPVDPMRRVPIDQPLGTGVRCIDALLTAGKGQRLGIFSGPGIGKSTLLGMMARQTDADVSVVALIGERGREVRDFIEHSLGPEGLKRTVVIAATSDESALLRIRAALYASAVAEFFRDQGLDVLLVMDSITRFCQAARQVGLAVGEPPATKGYTPSVFAALPALLERSGRTEAGSITAFYSILVEGDDLTEPISDACRGILDGHIVLARDLADRGHWPAIDILQSVSRVARAVTDPPHRAARATVARLINSYREVEDLVNIGAYSAGSNADFDLAIEMRPAVDRLLAQAPEQSSSLEQARGVLLAVAAEAERAAQRLRRNPRSGASAPA